MPTGATCSISRRGHAIVYMGEHYVFDVFLGWIYAIIVYFGVLWVRRRWAARRGGDESGEPAVAEGAA